VGVRRGRSALTFDSFELQRPFLGYYVARYILWELSTPFLNAHWYAKFSFSTRTFLADFVSSLLNRFFVRVASLLSFQSKIDN